MSDIPNYFVLRTNASVETATPENPAYMEIEDWLGTKGFHDWGWGTLAKDRPTEPVELRAVPYFGYTGLPDDFQDFTIPLMSKRLKQVLDEAGVNNINYFPVTLRNTETNQTYDFFVFNLVGRIAAVDLEKSKIESHDGDFKGDSQIHDLVLDESKINGLLMFRLEEQYSTILVHQKVKEAIEKSGITTVKFLKPEDFMGL